MWLMLKAAQAFITARRTSTHLSSMLSSRSQFKSSIELSEAWPRPLAAPMLPAPLPARQALSFPCSLQRMPQLLSRMRTTLIPAAGSATLSAPRSSTTTRTTSSSSRSRADLHLAVLGKPIVLDQVVVKKVQWRREKGLAGLQVTVSDDQWPSIEALLKSAQRAKAKAGHTKDDNSFFAMNNLIKSKGLAMKGLGLNRVGEGSMLKVQGRWDMNELYGLQVDISHVEELPITCPDAMATRIQFMLDGVGKATAKKIVSKFGLQSMEVLAGADAVQRLVAAGFGKKTAHNIKQAYTEATGEQAVEQWLADLGLAPHVIEHLVQRYGCETAQAKMRDDPYLTLMDIAPFDFAEADLVAFKLGRDPDHPSRGPAAMYHTLNYETMGSGHTFTTWSRLRDRTREKLLHADKQWNAWEAAKPGTLTASPTPAFGQHTQHTHHSSSSQLQLITDPEAALRASQSGTQGMVLSTRRTGSPQAAAGNGVGAAAGLARSPSPAPAQQPDSNGFGTGSRGLVAPARLGDQSMQYADGWATKLMNMKKVVLEVVTDPTQAPQRLTHDLPSGTTQSSPAQQVTVPALDPVELPTLRQQATEQPASVAQPTLTVSFGNRWPDNALVYSEELHEAERIVARTLAGLLSRVPTHLRPGLGSGTGSPSPPPAEEPEVQAKRLWVAQQGLRDEGGVELTEKQMSALRLAESSPVMLLTGAAGCGKTFSTKSIVSVLQQQGKTIMLCAPTGRAAQRLQEAGAEFGLTASTIHRLLKFKPKTGPPSAADRAEQRAAGEAQPEQAAAPPGADSGAAGADGAATPTSAGGSVRGSAVDLMREDLFEFNSSNPLPAHAVLVDEASMLDVQVAAALFRAMAPGCQLILVGDPNQLPPVGPGSVLKDMIDSGLFPRVHLNQIFRQSQGSSIVAGAHQVMHGRSPITMTSPPPAPSHGASAQPTSHNPAAAPPDGPRHGMPQKPLFDILDAMHTVGREHGEDSRPPSPQLSRKRLSPVTALVQKRSDKKDEIQKRSEQAIAALQSALGSDGVVVLEEGPDTHMSTVVVRLIEGLRKAGVDVTSDVQVLSPTKQHAVGIQALNKVLQPLMNPFIAAGHVQAPLSNRGLLLRQGDRVVQIENNYDNEVFNGDIGTVQPTTDQDERNSTIRVAFAPRPSSTDQEAHIVEYTGKDQWELQLAWATTVHKAQGAEYPVVIMVVHDAVAKTLKQRKLLYTAITRGRKLLFLVTTSQALAQCTHDSTEKARNSLLTVRTLDMLSREEEAQRLQQQQQPQDAAGEPQVALPPPAPSQPLPYPSLLLPVTHRARTSRFKPPATTTSPTTPPTTQYYALPPPLHPAQPYPAASYTPPAQPPMQSPPQQTPPQYAPAPTNTAPSQLPPPRAHVAAATVSPAPSSTRAPDPPASSHQQAGSPAASQPATQAPAALQTRMRLPRRRGLPRRLPTTSPGTHSSPATSTITTAATQEPPTVSQQPAQESQQSHQQRSPHQAQQASQDPMVDQLAQDYVDYADGQQQSYQPQSSAMHAAPLPGTQRTTARVFTVTGTAAQPTAVQGVYKTFKSGHHSAAQAAQPPQQTSVPSSAGSQQQVGAVKHAGRQPAPQQEPGLYAPFASPPAPTATRGRGRPPAGPAPFSPSVGAPQPAGAPAQQPSQSYPSASVSAASRTQQPAAQKSSSRAGPYQATPPGSGRGSGELPEKVTASQQAASSGLALPAASTQVTSSATQRARAPSTARAARSRRSVSGNSQ